MGRSDRRKVGERGQVTIPKEMREKLGISGGDEIVVHEEDGKIILKTPVSRDELAEGYRRRTEELKELDHEMAETSKEADEVLGEAPEWDDEWDEKQKENRDNE
ncbi:MAG: AbrB/MazE/SpoVT family DNA-binding domain-containing protein [Halobacteria archaeon]|nr:AbrB/MazE/SpoVT family DNA-binding domain-containing protein [Halobacteria archaeon]